MAEFDQSVERIDPLTGAGNLLSFLETFTGRLAAQANNFSLLLVDLNKFGLFNEERGRDAGDAILHWVSIVMQDLKVPVYSIGSIRRVHNFRGPTLPR